MRLLFRTIVLFLLLPFCVQASDMSCGVEETKGSSGRPVLQTFLFAQDVTDPLNPYPNVQKCVDATIRQWTRICPYTLPKRTSAQQQKDDEFLLEECKKNSIDAEFISSLATVVSGARDNHSKSLAIPSVVPFRQRCLAQILCCYPSYGQEIKRLQTERELAFALEQGRLHRIAEQNKKNIQQVHVQITKDLCKLYEEVQLALQQYPTGKFYSDVIYPMVPRNPQATEETYGFIFIIMDLGQEVLRIEKSYTFGRAK